MEQKRRGRPPGTGKKEQTIVNIPVGEGKKRGRKRIEKPLTLVLPNVQMEGEIEGSEVEKLKDMVTDKTRAIFLTHDCFLLIIPL